MATTSMRHMLQLKCFRSLWGTPSAAQLGLPATYKPLAYGRKLLQHVQSQGYDGIEASLSDLDALSGNDLAAARELLVEHDLQLVVGVYSGWVDYEDAHVAQQYESVTQQLTRYEQQLERVCTAFDASPTLVWINAHSGADRWRHSQQLEFLAHALEVEQSLNCHDKLSHETHRGRLFSSPWQTLELLQAFPSLRLTLDFSHWCVVAERLLDTPHDHTWLCQEVLPRVAHVHGRIGTAQTPQLLQIETDVSHLEVDRFERLWSDVWTTQQRRFDAGERQECALFTPEYGPVPYAPRALAGNTNTNTNTAAYDVDLLCWHAAQRERVRFQHAVANA